MSAWPKVKLGEVLRREARPVKVEAEETYREIGIRSHGKGLFHKEPVSGLSLGEKRVFWLKPGDFVLNIVFAWEGAVGLVGPAEVGMIGSHRFPTFQADPGRLDPRFLLAYFRTPEGLDFLGRVSPGGAGRNRTLSQTAFLALEIPLPPLAEQRRVVARIEELAAQIHEARTLRQQAAEETNAMGATASNKRFRGIKETKPLSALIAEGTSISYGVLVPGPEVDDGVPFIRIQDLLEAPARPSKRISPDVEKAYARTRLRGGEVLIAVVGATIGKVGVAPDSWRGANIARAVCRIIPGPEIDRDFLVHVLRSQGSQEYFRTVTRTLAQPTLNVGQLEQTQIPLPPLAEQRRIVAELDALQAEVDALKRHQAETAAELDALLPALLDRAFKGEL